LIKIYDEKKEALLKNRREFIGGIAYPTALKFYKDFIRL